MKLRHCVVLFCALLVVPGCSTTQDWGDDPLVLDQLQLLNSNDLWVELFSHPAQSAPCSFAICQNVLRGAAYEVVGDADDAKIAALKEVMRTWEPTGSADPFASDSSDFQLRDDIDIATSTGTAFLTVSFQENFRDGPDTIIADAILFSVTSDIDPNWLQDRVLEVDNLVTPLGLLLVVGILTVAVTALVAAKRSRIRP